ncbi:MAG: DUF378 domain-containing protein [Bacilli bacterium]
MKVLEKIALLLTIVGALNWGMVGLFDFNLVSSLFGNEAFFTRLVYALVGLAGIINIGMLFSPMKKEKVK